MRQSGTPFTKLFLILSKPIAIVLILLSFLFCQPLVSRHLAYRMRLAEEIQRGVQPIRILEDQLSKSYFSLVTKLTRHVSENDSSLPIILSQFNEHVFNPEKLEFETTDFPFDLELVANGFPIDKSLVDYQFTLHSDLLTMKDMTIADKAFHELERHVDEIKGVVKRTMLESTRLRDHLSKLPPPSSSHGNAGYPQFLFSGWNPAQGDVSLRLKEQPLESYVKNLSRNFISSDEDLTQSMRAFFNWLSYLHFANAIPVILPSSEKISSERIDRELDEQVDTFLSNWEICGKISKFGESLRQQRRLVTACNRKLSGSLAFTIRRVALYIVTGLLLALAELVLAEWLASWFGKAAAEQNPPNKEN